MTDADMSKATARGPHWVAADKALRKLAIFNGLPEHSQNAYRLTVSEAVEAAASERAELLAALRECEAAMSIIPPRTMKARYLEVLDKARAALAKAESR